MSLKPMTVESVQAAVRGLDQPAAPSSLPPGTSRVEEAQGKVAEKRRLALDPQLRTALELAAEKSDLKVRVTSGGQAATGPMRTGSHRHDYGRAADIDVTDPKTGKVLDLNDPRRLKFLEEAAAAGAGGTGTRYMSDPRKMHVGITGKEAVIGKGLGSYAGSPEEREAVARGLPRMKTPAQVAEELRARRAKAAAPLSPTPKTEAVATPAATPAAEPISKANMDSMKAELEERERQGETVSERIPNLEHYRQLREDLEKPIKMKIETPEVPSQLAPQFRRASARIEHNREFRDARWSSYSDIGAA